MVASRNFNSYVNWQEVLSSLDLTPEENYLPTTVACPLCAGGRLSILSDLQLGGQWYSCQKCGFAGDACELVAEATGKPLADAAREVFTLGSSNINKPAAPQIQQFVRKCLEVRKSTKAYWSAARNEYLENNSDLDELVSNLGIRRVLSLPLWVEGPGQLLGTTDQSALKEYYRLSADRNKKVFAGVGWENMIMTPAYDQPGRICGMHYIGRSGDIPKDAVFRMSPEYSRAAFCDAGLVMHPELRGESLENWNSAVFALPHHAFLLRIAVRAFASGHPGAMPLVSWHDGGPRLRTRGAWDMLRGHQILFWSPFFSPELILQAYENDALISTFRYADNSGWARMVATLNLYPPFDFLGKVQRSAKPWPAVVSEMLAALPGNRVQEFSEFLESRDVSPKHFAEELSRTGRLALLGKTVDIPREKVVELGEREFVEDDGKWYLRKQRRKILASENQKCSLISDAILRVDKIIYCQNAQKGYAQGRILFRDDEIPFYTEHKNLEKNALKWMQQQMIEAGRGIVSFAPSFDNFGMAIATAFHEPEVVIGFDRVGWDSSAGFVFPGYLINTGGDCVEEPRAIFPEGAPCRTVRTPELYYPQRLEPLVAVSYENQLFWAIFAAAAGCIFAPMSDETPYGIALTGLGAEKTGKRVAEKLGCLARRYTNAKQEQRLTDAEADNNWPLFIELTKRALTNSNWYDCPRNAMIVTPTEIAELLPAGREWLVIEGNDNLNPQNLAEVPDSLITTFISYVLAEDLFHRPEDPWPRNIFSWLKSFLAAQGVSTDVLTGARLLTSYPGENAATQLIHALSRSMADLTVIMDDAEAEKKQKSVGRVYTTERGIFLPRPISDFLYRKQCVPAPPPDYITAALNAEGVLISAGTMNGQMGWEIDGHWFAKVRRRWTERSYGFHQEFKLRLDAGS